jgi:alpha-mannosidase
MNQVEREKLRNVVQLLVTERNGWAERFLCEVEFAEGLAKLYPAKAKQWGKAIAEAWTIVADEVATGRLDELPAAVARAEQALAAVGKVAKQHTIHCVGHAHIDMNWMWSWPETVAVTGDSFLTALKLMDEFPDFCFTQSQASVYAIARDYHPEMFEQIKRRVAEGRWEIVAVHWVEGDKNIASGESLARHMLYTRRFMAEQFGLSPEDLPLDWEPDTFGHAATIPTILSRGAVRQYYMCRGGAFAKPPVFRWKGPDGSQILVNLETTWYNDHIGPHNAVAALAFYGKAKLQDWMCVYGVGDHGGGPTRRDIHRCHELDSWPIYPNFRMATTRAYYGILDKHAEQFPELTGELNFEFPGCYTTQTRIKRANRLSEHLLEFTEAAAVLAWRAGGREYPSEQLRQAWTDALFGHFHDILPGSGVRETREYQMGLFQRTAAVTSSVTANSLRALLAKIDTSSLATPDGAAGEAYDAGGAMGAGVGRGSWWGDPSAATHSPAGPRTYMAFNALAWPRKETLTVTAWDSGDGGVSAGAFVARFPDGRVVPAQRLTAGSGYWGHQYVDLAVPVEVAALGYQCFTIEPAGRYLGNPAYGYPSYSAGAIAEIAEKPTVRVTGPLAMENEFLSVRVDSLTAGIVELVDRASGANLADPARPAGVLEYVLERPGGMTAWLIHPAQKRVCPLAAHSVEVVARGPHAASIVAKMKVENSTVTVSYWLRAGQRRLDVEIEVDWFERGTPETGSPSLRLLVPLALNGAKGLYEIPFGSIERTLNGGEEVPALRWADVTGKAAGGATAGCALLNDSKYGHSLDGSTLGLTLIRSSYDPDPLPEIGHHSIRVALVPHAGKLAAEELIRAGAGLNQPVRVVAGQVKGGTLPPAAGGVTSVRPAGVILSCLKKAEDESAVVIRLYETAGKAATATVVLGRELLGRVAGCVETDLLERPLAKSTAKCTAGKDGFTVKLPAYGIASVKVTLES